MKNVLDDNHFADDCEVAVEYNLPESSKRVDFMIMGNNGDKDYIVIIELKQWAKVEKVNDSFKYSIMSDLKSHEPVVHPSYQVYSYKCWIRNYCDDKNVSEEIIKPCAYLHNLTEKYRPIYWRWYL